MHGLVGAFGRIGAINIGPGENSPRSALRVRSRKQPPAELMSPCPFENTGIPLVMAAQECSIDQAIRGVKERSGLFPFSCQKHIISEG
ncbi:hypothetical protein BHMPCIPO_06288 [Ensifer sesbaniae]|nr:hypothetical protein [Ensifer sesbaniae]